ncbi:hypothetical protein [Streptomyces sp. WAC 04229]|uniref:hypothetical protein n=1 Tax=Streptomyces sp. WAC 04229 TaxID=2203206 RepID=UPI003D7077CA
MTPLVEFTSYQIQLRLDALDRVRAQLQTQRRLGSLGDVDQLWNPSHTTTAQAGTRQECHPPEGA